jgi:hypothetical protein
MAKAKDLAALAGLAGLAYAMRNKGDSSKTDTGDETDRLKARKPAPTTESVVSRPGQSTITGDQVNPDANTGDTSNYSNEGRTPMRTATPMAKPKVRQPAVDNTTAAAMPSGIMAAPVDRRNLEAGMSRGTRRSPTLMKKGGMTASKRADGIASKGKTKCKMY